MHLNESKQVQPGEELLAFCRRRNRTATIQMKKVGLWSQKSCGRAVRFHEHIVRDTAGKLWSKQLLALRDEQWLQWRDENKWPMGKIITADEFLDHVAFEDMKESDPSPNAAAVAGAAGGGGGEGDKVASDLQAQTQGEGPGAEEEQEEESPVEEDDGDQEEAEPLQDEEAMPSEAEPESEVETENAADPADDPEGESST